MTEDPLERIEREEREKKENKGPKTVMTILAVVAVLLAGVLALLIRSFPQLFSVFDTTSMLIVAGTVVVCGVLICVLSTYFVVNKLVSLDKDHLYY